MLISDMKNCRMEITAVFLQRELSQQDRLCSGGIQIRKPAQNNLRKYIFGMFTKIPMIFIMELAEKQSAESPKER